MSTRHTQNRLRLLGGTALLIAVLLPAWQAAGRQTPAQTGTSASLSQAQIVERARALAQSDFIGTPAEVRATQTTLGELQAVSCNPIGGWLSGTLDAMQARPNWCDPTIRVWVVKMMGEFRQRNQATDSVEVVLDESGRMIRLNSGALVRVADSDGVGE